MLGSNQRPPPCKRQNRMSWMFTAVQQTLQIGIFSICSCRVRSLMFRRVVVKLSSTVVELATHGLSDPDDHKMRATNEQHGSFPCCYSRCFPSLPTTHIQYKG